MPHMTLAVTTPVINQVRLQGSSQRQIAVQDASPELLELISRATAANRITFPLNGEFDLVVGDTRAIWGVHQTGIGAEDFSSIYELLARRAGNNVRFTW